MRRRLREGIHGRVHDYVRAGQLSALLALVQRHAPAGCAVIVGSNSGQEVPVFRRHFREIHLVDPLIPQLKMHPECASEGIHLHPVALSCTTGTRSFHVASNNGESSSLGRPTHHLEEYPGISFASGEVTARRLADMDFFPRASMLMMDVQGSELDVLRSAAPKGLGHLSAIMCEYSLVPLYEGSGGLAELYDLLSAEGFLLAFTSPPYLSPTECTGDAVFLRRDVIA